MVPFEFTGSGWILSELKTLNTVDDISNISTATRIDQIDGFMEIDDLQIKKVLSEKEIDFLILFSKSNNPINRNLVLKKVWKYSDESETHTVETHIHRLRKKILEKFGDKNFIKNNEKGYYI